MSLGLALPKISVNLKRQRPEPPAKVAMISSGESIGDAARLKKQMRYGSMDSVGEHILFEQLPDFYIVLALCNMMGMDSTQCIALRSNAM